MVTRRIIPCLDIRDGRTVKGVNFVDLRDAGDPVGLASAYAATGADELVFLDISATDEKRKTLASLVRDIARTINIPFTVGGGINNVGDVETLLDSGADKISVNSAAVRDPKLIDNLARAFGSQCIVLAVDARNDGNQWMVHTHGGKKKTEKELFAWVSEAQERGAGEVLFTSMDHDGTKSGFAVEALSRMHALLKIPVIASGGAGNPDHFLEVFEAGKADAALAASIFHFGEISIPSLKQFLFNHNIPVRLTNAK